MEQTKGPLGSQMQIQQQQQQQNQSKKKSKNKKKSSKNVSAVVTRPIDEQQKQQQEHRQPSSEGVEVTVMENGLTDQLKQQLHIGNNSSSSCSKSNNNKVNGLMKENLNKSSKACPPTLNDLQIDKKLQSSPALNGHHHRNHHLPVQEDDTATVGSSMTNKKSKRKPNNKKNTNTLENKSNYSNNLENGHCPANTMVVTTNGFQHKQVEEQPQQTDTTNTAIKANKTNATNSTTSVTTNSETNINNNTTPNGVRAETSEVKQKQQPSTHLDTLSSCTSQITEPTKELDLSNVNIEYKEYESELQMHDIMRLIQAELSEPYSIYTYRYFIYNWPKLCFLAAHGNEYVGAIVCKLDMHMNVRRGYIAMLAVRKEYRKLKIGTTLVQKAIEAMLADKADEVVLETEMSNLPALRLYENLGFVRDKRLFRYYLNGVDALRLKLWFR